MNAEDYRVISLWNLKNTKSQIPTRSKSVTPGEHMWSTNICSKNCNEKTLDENGELDQNQFNVEMLRKQLFDKFDKNGCGVRKK